MTNLLPAMNCSPRARSAAQRVRGEHARGDLGMVGIDFMSVLLRSPQKLQGIAWEGNERCTALHKPQKNAALPRQRFVYGAKRALYPLFELAWRMAFIWRTCSTLRKTSRSEADRQQRTNSLTNLSRSAKIISTNTNDEAAGETAALVSTLGAKP